MMSKKEFEHILDRYLKGTANEQEKKWIETWYSKLESKNNYPAFDSLDERSLHESDWKNIQEKIGKKKNKTIFFWPTLAAAAALVIFGIVFIYNLDRDPAKTDAVTTLTLVAEEEEIVNESGNIKRVALPDSSTVLLQPHSTIRISANFNKGDRKISLKGEAFFDVRRDESQPFKVYTHNVISTVLGTSFTIKAPSANEKIIVVVKTGRVAVSSNLGSNKVNGQEVIVTPNQQAVFTPEDKILKATIVQDPVVIAKPPQAKEVNTREIFDEEPIINILQKIETMYGIEIRYDEGALSNCIITTAFSTEGLYERLDILSKAIGGTYRLEGPQIIFQSKGCPTIQ